MARRASLAGKSYNGTGKYLRQELDGYLQSTRLATRSDARAIIAPHGEYFYSGPCAAFAFAHIDSSVVSRVFILGPGHSHRSKKCELSRASVYETPLRNLPIDLEIYEELRATGQFEDMDKNVDEAEHSLELHLPFIARIFEGRSVKIVPVMVGRLPPESEVTYGKIFAKYIDDPSNFFSISSDFCHWGPRYEFFHYDKNRGPIYKSIEALDRDGMKVIEGGDPEAFTHYLDEYKNTICGRHAIGVFLNMLKYCDTKIQTKFLAYDQSWRCTNSFETSVSYASAVAIVHPEGNELALSWWKEVVKWFGFSASP